MTTSRAEKKRCGVCGATVEVQILTSVSTLGAPDTDSRPAPMLRDTLRVMIQRCDQCGNCASDISAAEPARKATVMSDDYKKLAMGGGSLARDFLAASWIAEAIGQPDVAGWCAVRAAWASDDAGEPAGSAAHRARAIELFRSCAEAQMPFTEPGFEQPLLVDLLRRARRFADAKAEADASLATVTGQPREILRKQLDWIAAKDHGQHSLDEVAGADLASAADDVTEPAREGASTLDELAGREGRYVGMAIGTMLMMSEPAVVKLGDRLRCFDSPIKDRWILVAEVRVGALGGGLGAHLEPISGAFPTSQFRCYLAAPLN